MLQRRYILCYNPREAQRERKHREQVVKELEEELKSHSDRQATARWAIDLLASGRYKRYLTIDKQDRIRLDPEAIQQASKHDGKWVLQTNDDTITVEDAAAGYKGLLVIERAFRTLKNTRIKMEPMFHWLPKRIEAHVKLCVFSLLIERVAELECKQPWSHIQRTLSTLQATEFQTKKNQFFQRNEPASELVTILKSLKIPMPKTVLDVKSAPSET
jgi:transposase